MAAFSRAPGRPTCKYGDACFRKNAEHWKEFDHSDSHPLLAGSKRDLSAIGSSSSSCCNASEAKRARTMVQDGAIALLCPLSSSSAAAIRLSRGATILGRGSGGLDSLRLSRQHIRLTSVETNAGHVTYDEEPRFLVESIGPNGSEIRSSADGSTAILKPKQTNTAELRISDVLCLLPGDELRFRLEAIAEQHATAGEAAGLLEQKRQLPHRLHQPRRWRRLWPLQRPLPHPLPRQRQLPYHPRLQRLPSHCCPFLLASPTHSRCHGRPRALLRCSACQ